MELKDKPINPMESLELIQTFISGARYDVKKSAFGFIFWGVLIPVAALLNYFLAKFTVFALPWLPWPVLMIGGFLFTAIFYSRHGRKRGVTPTYAFFFKWLFTWGGLTYFLLAFICTTQAISPMPYMMALTSLLIGVSGFVIRYKPLIWGGVLFLVVSVVSVFISPLNQLLVMALSILLGYLLPGILLTRKKE